MLVCVRRVFHPVCLTGRYIIANHCGCHHICSGAVIVLQSAVAALCCAALPTPTFAAVDWSGIACNICMKQRTRLCIAHSLGTWQRNICRRIRYSLNCAVTTSASSNAMATTTECRKIVCVCVPNAYWWQNRLHMCMYVVCATVSHLTQITIHVHV